MVFVEFLIILAILVYIVNVIPILMPPTWTIIAFCYINFHLPLIPTVIIGAIFATLGRITLYHISKTKLRNFFSRKSLDNYDALGKFFDKKQKLSIPLFLAYAFFPISSNYVYIAAGLAKINIKILALSFFIGRLFSYFAWATTTHIVINKLEDVFSNQFSNISILLIQFLGFAIVIMLGKINWKRILKI